MEIKQQTGSPENQHTRSPSWYILLHTRDLFLSRMVLLLKETSTDYGKCKQYNMKGWEKQTKGKTLTAVLNEKSDFTLSTWPLRNRNGKQGLCLPYI
jgi:hypothetical protein